MRSIIIVDKIIESDDFFFMVEYVFLELKKKNSTTIEVQFNSSKLLLPFPIIQFWV